MHKIQMLDYKKLRAEFKIFLAQQTPEDFQKWSEDYKMRLAEEQKQWAETQKQWAEESKLFAELKATTTVFKFSVNQKENYSLESSSTNYLAA